MNYFNLLNTSLLQYYVTIYNVLMLNNKVVCVPWRCGIVLNELRFSALVRKASVSICHSQMKWSHHILIHASHSAEGWALWKSPIVWFNRVQLRALPLSCSCWPERMGARPRTAGMWRWAMTGFLSLLFDVLPPSGS